MIGGQPLDRDRGDVEALAADRYLEAILDAAERRVDDAPADALLDDELRDAARVLRRSLVRVHPSFRFEERLASRLAELGARGQAGPRGEEAIVLFPRPGTGRAGLEPDPLLGAILAGVLDPSDAAAVDDAARTAAQDATRTADGAWRSAGPRRPLLVGGAITSAAISLAGVAWVAWRAARPEARAAAGRTMARAARAAHARRAGAAPLSGGIGGPA